MTELPHGLENVQLFASREFITEARGRSIGHMAINAGETATVIRKARAGDTIPLGAIALVSPEEARSYATTEMILHGAEPAPDIRLAADLRLRRISNGQPSTEVSWTELLREQQDRGSITFRLGVMPSEPAIALSLYNVAGIAPGKPANDKWFETMISGAAGLVGLVAPKLPGIANMVGDLGENIGNLRRDHDLQTIDRHRPVMLGQR